MDKPIEARPPATVMGVVPPERTDPPRRPAPDRDALRRLAERRGGVWTTEDAIASGWTPARIRTALAAGRWCRLRRGVFAASVDVERAAARPDRAHRLQVAAALAATTNTWASHWSAAAVWALDTLTLPPMQRIRLSRPAAGTGARVQIVGDIDIHECGLRREHRTERQGVRTTTAARTVADLARAVPLMDAVVLLDSAMRQRGVRRSDVTAVLDACRGWPDTGTASDALDLADPAAESVFESVSRVELVRRGLRPETQCWLTAPGAPAVRVDFLWWPQRTVGEADGLGKYAKYGTGSRLHPLQAEKLRQELLEEWGFEVVRWGWREMRAAPDDVAAQVHRGFARSAVRQEIRARNGERDVVRRLATAPWELPWSG